MGKGKYAKQHPRGWFIPVLAAVILLAACAVLGGLWWHRSQTPLPAETVVPTTIPTTAPTEAAMVTTAPAETTAPTEPPDPALSLLSQMTLEEKVGQMIFAQCPVSNAAQAVSDYHLGGYLLFGKDFQGQTPESITQIIQIYQSAAAIPLFIGVDEEGGWVNRVSQYQAFRSEPFASPQTLYRQGGLEAIQADAVEKCRLLGQLGINVNFAPVADVSMDPADFIYSRSFGQDAEATAEYVSTVVATMKAEGMGSVLKHFPGYGDNADTHTGVAYDDRPYETFLSADFLPFRAGIAGGADMVLVAHNIVTCMDETYPASLSPQVHAILREELGFDGVIITDDLTMSGIQDFSGATNVAVQAVQAGNDLILCSDFAAYYAAILEAVEDGTLSEARIDESVLRILRLKMSLGLM